LLVGSQDRVNDFDEQEGDIIVSECEGINGELVIIRGPRMLEEEQPMNAANTTTTTTTNDGLGREEEEDDMRTGFLVLHHQRRQSSSQNNNSHRSSRMKRLLDLSSILHRNICHFHRLRRPDLLAALYGRCSDTLGRTQKRFSFPLMHLLKTRKKGERKSQEKT
jgi:hypothetical protein